MDNFKIIEKGQKEPSLSEAQKFVGGYVEGLELPNGDYILLNEEGLIHNLESNSEANDYIMEMIDYTTLGLLAAQTVAGITGGATTEATDSPHFDARNPITLVGPVILIKESARKIWS